MERGMLSIRTMTCVMFATVVQGAYCSTTKADGGVVRVLEQRGAYRLCVFTAPNPLRAGPIDISVFVQNVATGQPVEDAKIELELTAPGQNEPSIFATATVEAATNKLLHAAKFNLPEAGEWNVGVQCILADQTMGAEFLMLAAAPLPRWRSMWPWFTWPLVVIAFFGIHRRIVWMQTSRAS